MICSLIRRRLLLRAVLVGALSTLALPAQAVCPTSLAGKRYSSQIRFYDAQMNFIGTCVTTNTFVVQDGVSTFPGTGYCTDTAGNTSAYTKLTTIRAGVSDACLQYFSGQDSLGNSYVGWNIVVDNGRLMYSVGATVDGSIRFFDRLELH